MGLTRNLDLSIQNRSGRNGSLLNPEPVILQDGNTVAWYDYTKVNTVIKDGSNYVSAWNSRIGNNHLLQAVGTNQPVLTASGILFDGIDNFLKTVPFALIQPEFIYIVFKQVSWLLNMYYIDGNTTASFLIQSNPTAPSIRAYSGAPSAPSANLAIGKYGIVRVLFNGASSKFFVNNDNPITGDFGSSSANGVTLGAIGSGLAQYANIEVKEIIIRKVADSAQNESSIYAYLKKKYLL